MPQDRQDKPLVATAIYASTVFHLTSEVAFSVSFVHSPFSYNKMFYLLKKGTQALQTKSPLDKKCLPILKSKERNKVFYLNDYNKNKIAVYIKDISFKLNLFPTEWVLECVFVQYPKGNFLLHSPEFQFLDVLDFTYDGD